MNLTHITNRIEIAFWDRLIFVLDSVKALRDLLSAAISSPVRFSRLPYAVQILLLASVGLSIGYSLGLLIIRMP